MPYFQKRIREWQSRPGYMGDGWTWDRHHWAGRSQTTLTARDFDPSEPRIGKGSAHGGEWSGSGIGRGSGHETTKVVSGQRVTASGGALPSPIQVLKIPPAWTDVTDASDPKAGPPVTRR